MNWDRIEGNWKQLRGILTIHWGRFTEDELVIIAGKRSFEAGKLQERYGISRDQARQALVEFETRQRDWSTRR